MKIGDIAAEVRYGSSSKTGENADGVPVIRMGNIINGTLDFEKLKYLPSEHPEFPLLLLEPGDILFNRTNSAELVGKTAVYRGYPKKCSFASYLIRVRLREGIPEWVSYYLNSSFGRAWIKTVVSQQCGQANVNGSKLKDLEIRFPPVEEQRRIVARIEELFSRLDAGVAALRHAKAQLQRYRQSVLAAAVTGQLTQEWREQHPDTEPADKLLQRILKQRREQWSGRGKYNEAKGPKLEEAPEVPEGWQIASVDQICVNFDGQRIPLKRADRDQRSGNIPYYGASGIIDDIDDFLFDGDYLLIAEDGANLLSRSTPIAFQAHGMFWVNNHAHVVQARAQIPIAYVELFFNGRDITRFVTGTAQPKLTQANLNQIPVTLPPLAEQHQIVAEVEARTTAIDHLEAELDRQITRSNRLRESILSSAFAGKI